MTLNDNNRFRYNEDVISYLFSSVVLMQPTSLFPSVNGNVVCLSEQRLSVSTGGRVKKEASPVRAVCIYPAAHRLASMKSRQRGVGTVGVFGLCLCFCIHVTAQLMDTSPMKLQQARKCQIWVSCTLLPLRVSLAPPSWMAARLHLHLCMDNRLSGGFCFGCSPAWPLTYISVHAGGSPLPWHRE